LKDYEFVKQFAFQPTPEKKPIDKKIFEKIVFINELFRFLDFEETMLYTSMDIDLNSIKKEEEVNEQNLIKLTQKNLNEAFTCDRLFEPKE